MTANQDGSALIETLIATAIVSMMLAACFHVAAESAARRRAVEARRYALMTARSQMAAVGSATPLVAGTTQGVDGPDIWRLDMQPCESEAGSSAFGTLYCIQVSVRSAKGGSPLVTLKSRRLAPPT